MGDNLGPNGLSRVCKVCLLQMASPAPSALASRGWLEQLVDEALAVW
jgi:hypothetical protein